MASSTNSIEKVLDRCILDVQSGKMSIEECLHAHMDIQSELEPLLRLAVALQEVPQITASDSFKAAAPARMQNLIISRPASPDQNQASEPIYKRIGAAFLGLIEQGRLQTGVRRLPALAVFVLILLTAALLSNRAVTASANALPGEAFYSTKLTMERIQLSLSQTDLEDSYMHLEFASRRVHEASRLVDENRVEHIDLVLEDYVRQLFETMAILLESESLSGQERTELALKLVHDMARNEEQLQDLLTLVPESYKDNIKELLTLSQYEQRIVLEVLRSATWGSGSAPSVVAENVSAAQPTPPSQRATKTPVPDPTQTPANMTVVTQDITATKTIFPISRGTPVPWWWLDTSFLPTDIDWLSIWPTVVDQIPPEYLTELPSDLLQPPFDIPTGLQTWIPVPPEGTPNPPFPPFPPHP